MSKSVGSNTSVHVGCFTREYEGILVKDPEVEIKYIATGTGTAMLSNRLSWFYDFKGPSLTLDTACSSSLNACHLACTSLKLKESSMAIIGGCNLFYNPDTCIPLTSLGFLSPDGKCFSFDHRANGYSRGEGFGVLVLKRMSDAIRDGDTIRAVIRNTSSNQDGKSPGITQPTKSAQVELIRRAYDDVGLDLGSTRYFEAHGTGTPVGDPIEASAISEVFSKYRSAEDPIYIGALKSNIGHLEGAAGIAGLLKAIYVLERGIIPGNLHFEKPNVKIPAEDWNFKFPLTATPWIQEGLRRASVNSFGFGGSNAHVILEDALHYMSMHNMKGIHRTVLHPKLPLTLTASPNKADGTRVSNGDHAENGEHAANGIAKTNGEHLTNDTATNGHNAINGHTNGNESNSTNGERRVTANDTTHRKANYRIFVLSAFDENGIQRLADAYHGHLIAKVKTIGDDENAYLDDLSYTLANKRTQFPWRASIVANSVTSLTEALGSKPKAVRAGTNARLAFIFTGQGAQWHAMGRELLAYPVFNQSLHAADNYLRDHGCPWSLMEEFLKDEASSTINDPAFSQPICTALQVALVELLDSWSVSPNAVVGHSSGEIAAAFAAGAISRESAWKLAYYRGMLSSQLAHSTKDSHGGMLSVALSHEQAREHIARVNEASPKGSLTVGCINSPKSVTISGNLEKIDALKEILDGENVFARKLQVENAYHSASMMAIADEYGRLISHIRPGAGAGKPNQAQFYSSLTGAAVPPSQIQEPSYWVDNLVCPVKFSDAVSRMFNDLAAKVKKLGVQQTSAPLTEVLEIGPHAALRGPLREIMEQIPSAKDVGYESILKRGNTAVGTALATVSWLHCRGHAVDMTKINMEDSNAIPSMLVDLPTYPFNHSKDYWKESRISKGYRFRKFPRHELLGAPVPDWNTSNAVWRNWIRLSENPWINDHRITGSTLYPAAGMLVMAIEASRQLANPEKIVKAFRFKEVALHMALRVPSSGDGIETHFYLRPYMDSTSSTSSSWSEFQLCSQEGEEWRENCRGLIQTEYETPYTPVDGGLEDRLFIESCAQAVDESEDRCRKNVSTKQLYELLSTVGFDFGPTFQTVSDVRIDPDMGQVATIKAPNIAGRMPLGYAQPHLIHPTTLDGVLQSVIVALTRGGREVREAMVPTSIKEMWIAADADAIHDTQRLCAKAGFLGLRQAEASLTSINPITRKPLIVVNGFVSTAVSSRHAADEDNKYRHLCFNIDWKPDPSFVDHDTAMKLFVPPSELLNVNPSQTIADVETICYMYMRRYMNSHHSPENVKSMKPHHQKYIVWMQHQFDRHDRGELIHAKADWNKLAEDETYFKELETRLSQGTAAPEAKLCVAIGKVLPQILSGEIDPLQILFNDKLTENVYRFGTGAEIGYAKLAGYLDSLAHKNPDMKLLEVGAGTGGATVPILKALTQHGDNEQGSARFDRYDFTDISPSFFELAKETFRTSADRMTFRTLNIENDPVEQGFEIEQYDVILAANVLHATKNIEGTLRNVRKLLKPNGKLFLYELTNTTLVRAGFGFGLLPGWWLSDEPYREWGPLLSVRDWSSHLQRTGFSGVDISFYDFPGEADQINSVLISAATTASAQALKQRNAPAAFIVIDDQSHIQMEIAKSLQSGILSLNTSRCELVTLSQLHTVEFERKLCIFLPELETSFLSHVNELNYKALQKMMTSLDSIFWLTQGGGRSVSNPRAELVTGFARAMRAENPSLKYITLSIETIRSADAVADTATKVFHAVFCKSDKQVIDNSFFESNGIIHIGRLVEGNYMNTAIARKTTQPVAQLAKFGVDPNRALKLFIKTPGLLDTLQFDDDPVYDLPLLEGEVEFRIMACGLNFLDIMVSLGQVIGTDLGVEGSGVVTRTGPKSKFNVGDRVCGIARGTMKTYARAVDDALVKIPDGLSWALASSLPVVYATSYAALYDIANIQKGESVLIHAAAGGIGQACIQLAKVRGAEIYATVGSIEKRDLLEETYGIPRDHILSSRDLTFASGIKRMTKGRGVDVIVNALSGAALRATWDCIAPFGRFVEVGKVDIYSSARLNMEKFKNNVSFEFVDVGFMANNQRPNFQRILTDVMHMVDEGKIGELHPVQVYPFARIQDAFRYMQSGRHSGKIVLEPHDEDEVMVNIPLFFIASCPFNHIGKWQAYSRHEFRLSQAESQPIASIRMPHT